MMSHEADLKKWEEMLWNGFIRMHKDKPQGVDLSSIEAKYKFANDRVMLVFEMPANFRPLFSQYEGIREEKDGKFIFADPERGLLDLLVANELRSFIFKQHKMLGEKSPFNRSVLNFANPKVFSLEDEEPLKFNAIMQNPTLCFYGSEPYEVNEFLDNAIAKVNSLNAIYPDARDYDCVLLSMLRYNHVNLVMWNRPPDFIIMRRDGMLETNRPFDEEDFAFCHLKFSFLKNIQHAILSQPWKVGRLGGVRVCDNKYPSHIDKIIKELRKLNNNNSSMDLIKEVFDNVVSFLEDTQKQTRRSKVAASIDFLGLYKRDESVQAFYDAQFAKARTIMPAQASSQEYNKY